MSFFNLNLINNKFANMSKEYARAFLAQTTILRITHSEDSFIVLIIRLIFISQDDMTKRKSFRLQGCTYQCQFACICLAVQKNLCCIPIDEDSKITIKIVFPKEQ